MNLKKKILFNRIEVGEYEATGDLQVDAEAVREVLKSKGLYKKPSTTDAMLGQAHAFAHTAIELYNKKIKHSPVDIMGIAPFIVNATFSIEIYLKAMHAFYGSKIHGHHLNNLYQNLPPEAQYFVLGYAAELRKLYTLEEGEDINTCLVSLNRAFEEWRYIYEKNNLHVEVQSIRYLLHVTSEACRRIYELKSGGQ